MPPRAFAVTLPIALAAWLASFLAGCSGTDEAPRSGASPVAPADSSPASVSASGIRYVTHGVHPASDFKRISEYFTGEANPGGDIVAYTDPNDRSGLYFMVAPDRLEDLRDGAIVVLEYVSAEKAAPQKCLFVVPAFPGSGLFRELRLGVTGEDWPAGNPGVVAWKVTLCKRKPGLMMPAGTAIKVGARRRSEAANRVITERTAAILAGIGEPIASAQSFLWALPAKPAETK